MALSDRERVFIQEYITNGHRAKDAAIKAGYSPKSAAARATALLRKPEVKMKLDEDRIQVARQYRVTHELLVENLVKIMDEGMSPKGSAKNALRAIELLAKHIGFFEADNKQKATEINLPVINWVKSKKK